MTTTTTTTTMATKDKDAANECRGFSLINDTSSVVAVAVQLIVSRDEQSLLCFDFFPFFFTLVSQRLDRTPIKPRTSPYDKHEFTQFLSFHFHRETFTAHPPFASLFYEKVQQSPQLSFARSLPPFLSLSLSLSLRTSASVRILVHQQRRKNISSWFLPTSRSSLSCITRFATSGARAR